MEKIDWNTWPRRDAYRLFSGISDPFYMVSFRQDVTALYRYTKARGLSFYYGMVWAVTSAINSVDAFRVALRAGELVRLPERKPSFTDLRPGAEQFHIVTMELSDSIDDFCREAARRSRPQTRFLDETAESDGLVYLSCLPWVDLTALTNERDLSAPGATDDSILRAAWVKYTY